MQRYRPFALTLHFEPSYRRVLHWSSSPPDLLLFGATGRMHPEAETSRGLGQSMAILNTTTTTSGTYALWHELRADQLRALASAATLILPVAATEQHGPHLATGTDTFIADAILERVRKTPPGAGTFVQLPTQSVGASDHHTDFGGTLSLPSSMFAALLVAQLRCLVGQGHRRILVFNSHGGNIAPIKVALADLAADLHGAGALVAAVSYWELAASAWNEIEEVRGRALAHACEFETSIIYAARPDLPKITPPARHDYDDPVGLRCELALPFSASTNHGAFGNPAAASAELGNRLLDSAAHALRKFLQDFANYHLQKPGGPRGAG